MAKGASIRVAVLAVQGAFIEHERMLQRLGATCVELRQAADLRVPFDALVLPGGESTVQAKLLRELGMLDTLRSRIAAGLPVLGTCAGLILLAQQVEEGVPAAGDPAAPVAAGATAPGALATLPVTVRRNAYGRQLGSFHTQAPFDFGTAAAPQPTSIPLTFIRAPYITELHDGARALAHVDGHIVAAQAGNQIGVAFHPELDDDLRIHERLLSLVS